MNTYEDYNTANNQSQPAQDAPLGFGPVDLAAKEESFNDSVLDSFNLCDEKDQDKYDRNDPNDQYFGSHKNDTGITPVGYKLLVRVPLPHDLQKFEDAGLHAPETAKDRYTNAAVAAEVIQLGSECYPSDRCPSGPWCKPGDWIVMSPYSGTRIKSIIMGKADYRFINDDSIEGIVPSSEYVERGNF